MKRRVQTIDFSQPNRVEILDNCGDVIGTVVQDEYGHFWWDCACGDCGVRTFGSLGTRGVEAVDALLEHLRTVHGGTEE